jgi:hypothetical protein
LICGIVIGRSYLQDSFYARSDDYVHFLKLYYRVPKVKTNISKDYGTPE